MDHAPAIPNLTTLDIFHDCSRIAWYWAASELGAKDAKGITLLYTTEDRKQVLMAMIEFNSLAWAQDVGWKITRADGSSY